MNAITKGMKKQDHFEVLYQAHLQVVKLLKEGRSNKEIVALLDVSKSYVSKIKCDYEHNMLMNSVSFLDGKKYADNQKDNHKFGKTYRKNDRRFPLEDLFQGWNLKLKSTRTML